MNRFKYAEEKRFCGLCKEEEAQKDNLCGTCYASYIQYYNYILHDKQLRYTKPMSSEAWIKDKIRIKGE